MQNHLIAFFKSWPAHLILIAAAVLAVYGHTLDVPFYLDDFSSIQENPVIYQWDGSFQQLWHYAKMRIVGYYTFVLNYQWHQFQFAGYHLVNIAIHILNGFAIFWLITSLMHTPALQWTSPAAKRWLPLTVALLFVLHPLQIQAVTYIVQRLASLATLFYLLAMACFVQARLAKRWLPRLLYAFSLLILIGLAFFTKQNTVTLPVALLLIEFTFLSRSYRYLLAGLALLSLIATTTWFLLATALNFNPFSLEAMEALTKETTQISRETYLLTQFNVLWTYIKLFFYPVGMHIDYHYPLTESWDQLQVLAAFAGHLLALGLAIFFLRKLPFIAFGILFYYLAHAVESSIIPIRDVVFEHRTYLPNLGLIIVCGWLLVVSLPQWTREYTTAATVTVALMILLAFLTWQRNEVWRDPVALWRNNVEQAPEKKRAWVILGKHLIQAGKPRAGIEALERSLIEKQTASGGVAKTYSIETVLNMVVAYKNLGEYEKALSWIRQALQNGHLDAFNRAKFLVNKGNVYYALRQYAEAELAYRQAIEVYPYSISARANLASIFAATGRLQQAKETYLEILTIDPNNQIVLQNLEKLKKMQ